MNEAILAGLLLAGVALWWYRVQEARDRARAIAGEFCRRQGWQLLDQTVTLALLDSLPMMLRGRWIQRWRFDYSADGSSRGHGEIRLAGATLERIVAWNNGERLIEPGPGYRG